MGATSVTVVEAPAGYSESALTNAIDSIVAAFTQLNSLANNTETTAITYSNPSGQTYATVDVFLNKITPTGTPKIQIISGTDGYELSVSTTANVRRRVRFVDIPATFLFSFTVKNNTGVALASAGNTVVITPQY